MNEWLNAQADGFALLFWFAMAGLVILLLTAAGEWIAGIPMRRRRKRLDAYRRYVASLTPHRE